MNELLDRPLTKNEFYTGMTTLKEAVVAEFAVVPEDVDLSISSLSAIREAFDQTEGEIVREMILGLGKRPDGRGPADIRPIWCEVGTRRGRTARDCSRARDADPVNRHAWHSVKRKSSTT